MATIIIVSHIVILIFTEQNLPLAHSMFLQTVQPFATSWNLTIATPARLLISFVVGVLKLRIIDWLEMFTTNN